MYSVTVQIKAIIMVTLTTGVTGCPNGTLPHYDNGSERCCRNVTCRAGTRAVQCTTENGPAQCEPCSKNFYITADFPSHEMLPCLQKQACIEEWGMVEVSDGGPTANRRCRCDIERSYFDAEPSSCPQHRCPRRCKKKECPAGQESNSKGQCHPCSMSTYKPEGGYERCQKRMDCVQLGMEFVNVGSIFNNSICKNETLFDSLPGETTPYQVRSSDHRVTPLQVKDVGQPEQNVVIVLAIGGIIVVVAVCLIIACVARWRRRTSGKETSSLPSDNQVEGYTADIERSASGQCILAGEAPPIVQVDPNSKATRHTNDSLQPLLPNQDGSIDSDTERKDFIDDRDDHDSGVSDPGDSYRGCSSQYNSSLSDDGAVFSAESEDTANSQTIPKVPYEPSVSRDSRTEKPTFAEADINSNKSSMAGKAGAPAVSYKVYHFNGDNNRIVVGNNNITSYPSIEPLNSEDSGCADSKVYNVVEVQQET